MTQDVGTALNRLKKYEYNKMIYVVGNEQDRHFEILFKLIEHMKPETKGITFSLIDNLLLYIANDNQVYQIACLQYIIKKKITRIKE
jgi:arginyl-tRNA synthetase